VGAIRQQDEALLKSIIVNHQIPGRPDLTVTDVQVRALEPSSRNWTESRHAMGLLFV